MAQFNADIALKVQSTGAERQVRKLERSINKVEDASRGILAVDKQIIRERKALIRLSGDQAVKAKKRIQLLSLQKTELSLQKRELGQIVRLEKQRISANKRAAGPSASGGGGGGPNPYILGAGVAASQAFKKGDAVGQLKADRIRISDALDATRDEVKTATAELQVAYQKYRGVVSRNGGGSSRSAMSRNAGVRPKVSALRDLKNAEGFGVSKLGGVDAQIDKLSKSAKKAQSPVAALGKKVLLLAGAYIGVEQAARFATTSIQKSIAAASSQQRIRALSEGFDAYGLVLSRANIAAEKFNISQIDANNQFAQLYGRLRPLGLSLDEVSTVFEGFNTAAALTGATAAESSGALLQLSQALGAGALRGEEFNSIAEQAPAVLQAIAKEVDKPVGQLKALAKEGKLTSDILVAALKRVKDEGADKLAAALDTPAQKVKKLQNRFEDLQVALGKLTLPATIKLVEDLTVAAENGTGKIEAYARAWDILATALEPVTKYAPIIDDFLDGLPERIAASVPGVGNLVKFLLLADTVISKLGEAPQVYGPTDEELGVGKGPGGDKPLAERLGIVDPLGMGTGSGRSAADIAKEQLEQGERLAKEFSRQVGLLSAKSDIERESLQIAFDRQDREAEIAKSLERQKDALIAVSTRIAALQKIKLVSDDALTKTGDFLEQLKDGMTGLADDVATDFAKFQDSVVDLEAVIGERLGQAIETSLVDGLTAAITGAEKLQDVLANIASDLLGDIGRTLIKSGLQGLGGNDGVGILSTLFPSGRASGGAVTADRPYMVGETGPELFVPQNSGRVVNNSSSAALDRYGLQDNSPVAPPAPSTFNIQTQVINGVEYATVDQVREMGVVAMKQGAKSGETRVMSQLRNSRSRRKSLGM